MFETKVVCFEKQHNDKIDFRKKFFKV